MRITKLTKDSSWLFETDDFQFFVDPWFTESQVDLAPWFSLQTREQAYPIAWNQNKPIYIFVSHPFSDHCHKETLLAFPTNAEVFAPSKVLKKILKWNHFEKVLGFEKAPFTIEQITPNSWLNLTHHAFRFLIEKTVISYAPHGSKDVERFSKSDVLMTTTTRYKLPFFLGGTVNLGFDEAMELSKVCQPKYHLASHDEQKTSKGLVGWFAKPKYYLDKLPFVELNQNEFIEL